MIKSELELYYTVSPSGTLKRHTKNLPRANCIGNSIKLFGLRYSCNIFLISIFFSVFPLELYSTGKVL